MAIDKYIPIIENYSLQDQPSNLKEEIKDLKVIQDGND